MSVVLANKFNGENKVAIPRTVADRLESDGVAEWDAFGQLCVSAEYAKNGDAIVNTLRAALEAMGLAPEAASEPKSPTGDFRAG